MRVLLGLGLIGFVLYTAATSVTVIESGERAVVRRFGRVLPEKPAPGLYIGMPWGIDRVERTPISWVRTITVGYDPRRVEEDAEVTPAGQFLTGDHNLVNVQAEISYSVREESVEEYVLQRERVDTVLAWLTEGVLSEYVAGRNVEDLHRNGQQELRSRLLEELPARLKAYELGIQVENANLKPLFPPEEVREDFEKVSQAEASIGTKTNEATQAAATLEGKTRSDIEEKLSRARAYASSALLEAESDAGNFLAKLERYREIVAKNENYLETLWLEEMTRIYAQMGQTGRIDLLDHFLERGGLSIFQSPGRKK